MMSESYAVRQLRRAIDEAVKRPGMQAGLPRVKLDASHANAVLLEIERLTAEIEMLARADGAGKTRLEEVAREAILKTTPVFSRASDPQVRKGYAESGELLYYKMPGHIVHKLKKVLE